MLATLWHAIVHFLGVDYGVAYGHWIWYNFWSGWAGSFFVGILSYFFLFYWHHTCHGSVTCLRWGKYEAAGGLFKLCYRHHPDLAGKRPHHELIHRLHREHKERTRGASSSTS
ncbi:MAG TPA: hypothetical protein VGR71_05000 [Nitrospira sp.]|nr:hypothetical protein [Nitrospira sp.]